MMVWPKRRSSKRSTTPHPEQDTSKAPSWPRIGSITAQSSGRPLPHCLRRVPGVGFVEELLDRIQGDGSQAIVVADRVGLKPAIKRQGEAEVEDEKATAFLAAEAPGDDRRATKNKHRSFYGSNDGELIRHAVFLRHITCLLQVVSRLRFVGELRPMVEELDPRYDPEFARRFVLTMCALDMSKRELMKKTGFKKSRINQYEKGSHPPRQALAEIASALNIPRAWLEQWLIDDKLRVLDDDDKAKIKRFEKLPKDEQLRRAKERLLGP